MTSKLYLRDAATAVAGTLPAAATVGTSDADYVAAGANTNHSLALAHGTSQQSASATSLAQTASQNGRFRRFISEPLAAQTISGTFDVHAGIQHANNNSNNTINGGVLAIWRPSTGAVVGRLFNTGGASSACTTTAEEAHSLTGLAISSQTAIDGDVLVFEFWNRNAQSVATAYLNTFYYDGTTDDNAASNAAFLLLSQTLTWLAPTQSAIAAGSLTTGGATITWTTDQLCTGYVEYGLTTGYGSSTAVDASTLSHLHAITGLAPGTLYHYRVRSTTSMGVETVGTDHTFTTTGETPDLQLIYQRAVGGAALTDTLPAFLLTSGLTYAWAEALYDTDGLASTTAVSTFLASFTQPATLTGLIITADPENGAEMLSWDASIDPYLHHYRVYWQNAAGGYDRIDGGPAALDDGLPALVVPTFTHYGANLGINQYQVTQHNGAAESDGESAAAFGTDTLTAAPGGGFWMVVAEDDARYRFPLRVIGAPRSHDSAIERFSPPGRGSTLHLKWGATGRRYSLTLQLRPANEGDLSTLFHELLDGNHPVWIKAPAGWLFAPLWCEVVNVVDTPGTGGMMTVQLDVEETERA